MPTNRVWTIGHSVRSADEFVSLLRSQEIDRLADIRTIPQSRRHPHFGRDALESRLQAEGIRYRHFKNLGGLRKPRADSSNSAWKNAAFRGYADHMQTKEFEGALGELIAYAADEGTAIMCAEAVWWQCHRQLTADALVARGIDVAHIMSARAAPAHSLTAFARVANGAVTYPGLI